MNSETINARNPFAETNVTNNAAIGDLKNQLDITAKVKTSMEQEMSTLKRTLFESKNQFREQLNMLTT